MIVNIPKTKHILKDKMFFIWSATIHLPIFVLVFLELTGLFPVHFYIMFPFGFDEASRATALVLGSICSFISGTTVIKMVDSSREKWLLRNILLKIVIANLLINGVFCNKGIDGDSEAWVEDPEDLGTRSFSDSNKDVERAELHETVISDSLNSEDVKESNVENDGKGFLSDYDKEVQIVERNIGTADSIKTNIDKSADEVKDKPQVTSVDAKEETAKTENANIENIDIHESHSAWLSWIKYLLDPFLEEFRDGIYARSNNSNSSDNASEISSNSTDLLSVVNETMPAFLNITDPEQNTTDGNKKTKFQCTGKNVTDNTNATVKIVSSSRLLQLLSFDKNETENMTDCLVVMFYAPWCHFCAKTAPHYNALSRAFPQLDFVAVDTAQFSNLLARFGTVSVPNILVFHQSRAAVKFNQTERTFEHFISFIQNTTGLEPNATVNVTEADYLGPISSVPTDDPDIFLWIAWMFVILYSSFMFIKSNKGQQWITRIRVLWQEHQHID